MTGRRPRWVRRKRGAMPWSAPAAEPWKSLSSVADYEAAALAATPKVRWVRVRAHVNDPAMPLGEVELRVRGVCRTRLSRRDLAAVRMVVVQHHPIGVRLTVTS